MNGTRLWNGTIKSPEDNFFWDKKNNNNTYELYASGDCDLNGRTYVPIKKGTVITRELKQKLNLM
tara:strand:- start:191 stop:385 length:195 start_codon:yes stop_codon:yes gene_type:complete